MSLDVRCACGWRCNASEQYRDQRIACPECGANILVHGRGGIPYGYAPYPTWQKRFPIRTPQARQGFIAPVEDPHAAAALWLGVFALMAALSGCGSIVGVMLAAFGLQQWTRSRAFNRRRHRPAEPRARVGLVLSCISVALAGLMMFGIFFGDGRTQCHSRDVKSPPPDLPQAQLPLARPTPPPPAQPVYSELVAPRERRAPHNAWEKTQMEYSEKVRAERSRETK